MTGRKGLCKFTEQYGIHSKELSEKFPKYICFCDLVLNHRVWDSWYRLTDISREFRAMWRVQLQPFTTGECFIHQTSMQCSWRLIPSFDPQSSQKIPLPFLQCLHLSSIFQTLAFKDENSLKGTVFCIFIISMGFFQSEEWTALYGS